MNNQLQAMLASYGRSILGAATTLYMLGYTDPKDLAYSLAGALVPVALRALNPNDKAFGRMPAEEDVATALATVKPKKAPAKKAPAKKTAAKPTKKD